MGDADERDRLEDARAIDLTGADQAALADDLRRADDVEDPFVARDRCDTEAGPTGKSRRQMQSTPVTFA